MLHLNKLSKNVRWAIAVVAVVIGLSFAVAPLTKATDSGSVPRATAAHLAASQTQQEDAAFATVCKTISVTHIWWSNLGSLQAQLFVPICYNGQYVWMHGNITCHAPAIGWATSISWCGWYNDSSGHWLGVGENFHAEFGGGFLGSIDLTPRWYINANGQNYAYSTY